jgi:hypothetical protein
MQPSPLVMSTIISRPFRREHTLPAGSRTQLKALLVSGVLSSAVYVVANVVAGLRWDGYSFASQAISELSAIGAPSRSVWIPFGIAYAVLLGAFGFGVWKVAEGRRGLRTTASLFIAMAVLGPFWPPMHMRGAVATLTDTMHMVFASVVSLMILLSIAFGANASGKTFRRYSIATIAVLLVFGSLTFLYAPALGANHPTPWLGVVERVMLAANISWVAALSIVLLRPLARGFRPDRSQLTQRSAL